MLRTIVLFCIIFLGHELLAQSLRVERISIKDGLSQSFVPCLLQDREGFVWIGTKNGLNKNLITNKFFYSVEYPHTSTILDFYRKDSIYPFMYYF